MYRPATTTGSILSSSIVKIAVPSPFAEALDYRCEDSPVPGTRVLVPLGKRQLVGIVLSLQSSSEIADDKLKTAVALDSQPALDLQTLASLRRMAAYYHHPLGEVVQLALPIALRRAQTPLWQASQRYTATELPPASKAHKQLKLYQAIQAQPGASLESLAEIDNLKPLLKKLIANHSVIVSAATREHYLPQPPSSSSNLQLNPEQDAAVAALKQLQGFSVSVLDGVTGSGKTEVYIELIKHHLSKGEQALLLIPEISLTPQTLKRLEDALGVKVARQHSAMGDSERLLHWRAVASGEARLLVGTRSSVFNRFESLGIIIIDEEHDGAYKQQEGCRYSAKTAAIMRAQSLDIPLLLGSATPSAESLYNIERGQYQRLRLQKRATGSMLPQLKLVDTRPVSLNAGLAPTSLSAIKQALERGEQALVFINRRGYAPTYYCESCASVVECPRCDARMTVHHHHKTLRCHHCDREQPLPKQCPQCQSSAVTMLGQGTERVTESLVAQFDQYPVLRIDRDTASTSSKLNALLAQARSGEPMILVGTQMLAKGHDFAKLSTVVMLDLDQSLLSQNFKALEELAQTLIQVSGRAGRAKTKSYIHLQTRTPAHAFLRNLLEGGYVAASAQVLKERKDMGFPPYRRLAMIRCAGHEMEQSLALLDELCLYLRKLNIEGLDLLGPAPAVMQRKAGRYRAQLLLLADTPNPLHRALSYARAALCFWPLARKLRWHIDVDPIELG